MKMTMTIKYRDETAEYEKREYRTVGAFDDDFDDILRNHSHEVKCVWVEPTNKPWERQRIDLAYREPMKGVK